MGILKQAIAKSYVKGPGYELGQSLSSNAVSTLFGSGGAKINVLEEYSGYAWKAINVKAQALSNEELYVEKRVKEKWQRVYDHEFDRVLAGEKGQRDLSELLEIHAKSKELYGESFWYFSKGERGNKPFAIYPLDPASMTVMVANDRVTGYVYQKDANRIVLDLDEVQHFKNEDIRNKFRGYGPMQAAGLFVRSGRYTSTYVNNFMENNAVPAGVIVAKGAVNDADWDLFKSQWSQKYSGIDNSGKTGFIRGESLDFVKTGLSLGEVDFDKLKNTSRDDIMLMFGISKPMFGIFEDINRASAVTARTLFAETYTEPELRALARKLTRCVQEWYGKDLRVHYSSPMPEDAEEKLQAYDKGVGRWFTVNEARAAYGLDPIEGGDVLQPQTAPQPEGQKSFLASKTIGKVVIRTKKAGKTKEDKEAYRQACDDLEDKYIDELYKLAIPVLKRQEEKVLKQIEPKKLVDAHFDAEDEARELADEVMSAFIGLAAEQGALAMGYIGNDDLDFNLTSVMEKYIRDAVAQASLGFTKDTQEYIADALADGINNGESSKQIAARIGAIYEDIYKESAPGYRLERIARTESARVSNKISVTSFKESGVVSKKEWFANPGRCGYCASLNGSIISIDATFVPKGSSVSYTDDKGVSHSMQNDYGDVDNCPLHPGCRCRPLPVIDEIEDF